MEALPETSHYLPINVTTLTITNHALLSQNVSQITMFGVKIIPVD